MLSDEEKKAIEYWKKHMEILHWNTQLASEYYMKILLNLIEKQSKEIEHQIEKRANQRQELAILNAKQIEFNKLVNTVNSYKGKFKKQQKEIEELKREKETNQQMIQLAETQILGYAQGYKDGLNKETTATAIVARERENQIIYEGMKHKINMEWVLKIRAKIEEYDDKGMTINLANRSAGKTFQQAVHYEVKKVLQSLLEKE